MSALGDVILLDDDLEGRFEDHGHPRCHLGDGVAQGAGEAGQGGLGGEGVGNMEDDTGPPHRERRCRGQSAHGEDGGEESDEKEGLPKLHARCTSP